MKNKKLLILALAKSDSGTAQYAGEIIKNIKKYKNVEILTSRYSDYDWTGLKNIKICKIPTYTNHVQFFINTLLIYPFLLIYLSAQLLLGRYDAIYLPYFHHWEYGIIKLFKLFGKDVIYTVHDGIQHYGEHEHIGQYIIFSSIKAATSVIFLTKYVRDIIDNNVSYTANRYVIPHGLISYPGLNKKQSINNAKPIILFLGRVSKYKGVELLLGVPQQLNIPIEIIIAGKRYYNIKYNDSSSIRVIDKWLSNEEISELVNQADILVLPYIEATQSGVAALGISARIPMVSTDVGGLREQIGNGALYVAPNSLDIAVAINKLLTDKELYAHLQYQLDILAKSLEWQNIANQVENICFKNNVYKN